MIKLIHGNCLDVLHDYGMFDCMFADPPDNINLGYGEYRDKMPDEEYAELLEQWVRLFITHTWTLWFSFNAKWTFKVGAIFDRLLSEHHDLEAKPCVQVFTFGQHNQHDFGNNHRPLWRLRWEGAPFFPDLIRVPSWRQLNGDKRANSKGRVPGDVIPTKTESEWMEPGTVFDFPRVTGNSKQRRSWHPTQLHEDLVERCIRSATRQGATVCDPFAGTATTLRVCKRIERDITTCDVDRGYCETIAAEHGLTKSTKNSWNLAAGLG